MTWIIVISILLFAFGWLLLAPLYLYISTSESRYEAGLTGIFKVMVMVGDDGLPELLGKFFFISFKIPVYTLVKKKPKEASQTKKEKKKKKAMKMNRKRIKIVMTLMWKVVRSFRLRQLKLNIDTGDVIRNAYLIPVFSIAYRNNINLSVNYEDKNEFILHFDNTIGRMLIETLRVFIKRKLYG